MTSCKSGRKHMHPKSRNARKLRNKRPTTNGSRKAKKGLQKGRKGSRKGKKGSQKGKKGSRRRGLGRFNQLKSMIEARLGISREEKPPTKYQDEQTVDFYASQEFPENCEALKAGDPTPCNGETREKRKQQYRDQVKKYHPDRNPECIEIATSKFKQLAKCCNSKNQYLPVEGEC